MLRRVAYGANKGQVNIRLSNAGINSLLQLIIII